MSPYAATPRTARKPAVACGCTSVCPPWRTCKEQQPGALLGKLDGGMQRRVHDGVVRRRERRHDDVLGAQGEGMSSIFQDAATTTSPVTSTPMRTLGCNLQPADSELASPGRLLLHPSLTLPGRCAASQPGTEWSVCSPQCVRKVQLWVRVFRSSVSMSRPRSPAHGHVPKGGHGNGAPAEPVMPY